jgi:ketosteroid isomerase-like protein
VTDPRVELIRLGIAAYNAGDVDAVVALLDEDVEIYSPPDFLNAGRFHGHEGFLRWNEAWNEAWESFAIQIEAIEPVGEDHIVAAVRQRARGRGSGIEIDQHVAYLWEVRHERCVYQALYPDVEQAMADAHRREAA